MPFLVWSQLLMVSTYFWRPRQTSHTMHVALVGLGKGTQGWADSWFTRSVAVLGSVPASVGSLSTPALTHPSTGWIPEGSRFFRKCSSESIHENQLRWLTFTVGINHCIHTHTHTHSHTLVYMHIHTNVHIHARTHTYTLLHKHMHILTHTYTKIYTHTYTPTNISTHKHTNTHILIHTHTHMLWSYI